MGLTNYTLKGNNTPENNPPETLSSEDGGSPQRATTLDRIVSAIYNSVVYAQRKVETEHLNRLMSTYFDKDGNALSFKINLPSNDGEMKEYDVPLLTLANHSHLAIKEIEMDLNVDLGHYGDSEEDRRQDGEQTAQGCQLVRSGEVAGQQWTGAPAHSGCQERKSVH